MHMRLESLAGNYTPRLGHKKGADNTTHSTLREERSSSLRSIQTRDLAQLKSAFSVKLGNIEYLKSILRPNSCKFDFTRLVSHVKSIE